MEKQDLCEVLSLTLTAKGVCCCRPVKGTDHCRPGSQTPDCIDYGYPGTSSSGKDTSESALKQAIDTFVLQLRRELPDHHLDIRELIGSGGYGNVYRQVS
jgi:hypothetical protein